MDQLDASRNLNSRAVPSSRNFKPGKYDGRTDGTIDSWLAMMRIHIEEEVELPEADRIFLSKEARAIVLNKPPEDQDTVD